jgi:peptidoglycan/LPS O-acetylase OafA/YrhL
MQIQTASRVYYPTLNIARGFAISIVLLYHLFWYSSFFRFGWIGVDLFFVLSGYLITDILLRTRENKFYFSDFYIKRILRILPLYYLTLLIFFTLSPIFFLNKSLDSTFTYYSQNQSWFWLFMQNWLMIFKGSPPEPYLTHLWSLAIEEQFYIIWPIIILIINKIKTLKKIIGVLIGLAILFRVCIWMINPHAVEAYYYNTFTRMDNLLIGSLISIQLWQEKVIPKSIIKLIFSSFFTLIICSVSIYGNVKQDNFLFPTIGYSITAAFFGCIIYLLITNESKLNFWIKNLYILNYLGKISYGLYVFHLPVYLVIAYLLSHYSITFLPLILKSSLSISILSLLATFVLSLASFYLLEKPVLDLKKYLVKNY